MEVQSIIDLLKDSSKILIGLGNNLYRNDSLPPDYQNWDAIKTYINNDTNEWFRINNPIFNIIKNKDFFIVTNSWDSHLNKTIPADRLFTPSGDCHMLQCYNACTTQLWDFETLSENEDAPLCPFCQSKLVMNIKTDAFFVRNLYTEEETNYHNWIHQNYNEEIVILEWEVGESGQKVITEQFENITSALPNIKLIRVNSRKIETPEVIKNKSSVIEISVDNFLAAIIND